MPLLTYNGAPVQLPGAGASAIYMPEPGPGPGPQPKSFATDSWATIAAAIKSGIDPYNLGDTKTDTITIGENSYTATFKIVDNKVGRYTTQSGVSHKVIEIQELFHNTNGPGSSNGFTWKASYTTSQGYPYSKSDLSVSTMDTTIYNFLPAALKAVLETTTVYSGPGGTNATASNLVPATNKLFCASMSEYYGDSASYGFANSYETLRNGTRYGQYQWYKNQGVTTSSYAALIKNRIEGSTAYYYWMRSPCSVSSVSTYACRVSDRGSYPSDRLSNGDTRVSPCFTW